MNNDDDDVFESNDNDDLMIGWWHVPILIGSYCLSISVFVESTGANQSLTSPPQLGLGEPLGEAVSIEGSYTLSGSMSHSHSLSSRSVFYFYEVKLWPLLWNSDAAVDGRAVQKVTAYTLIERVWGSSRACQARHSVFQNNALPLWQASVPLSWDASHHFFWLLDWSSLALLLLVVLCSGLHW